MARGFPLGLPLRFIFVFVFLFIHFPLLTTCSCNQVCQDTAKVGGSRGALGSPRAYPPPQLSFLRSPSGALGVSSHRRRFLSLPEYPRVLQLPPSGFRLGLPTLFSSKERKLRAPSLALSSLGDAGPAEDDGGPPQKLQGYFWLFPLRRLKCAAKRLAAFAGPPAAALLRAATQAPKNVFRMCRMGYPSGSGGPRKPVVSFSRLLAELRVTLSLRLLLPAAALSLAVGAASFCRSYLLGRLFDCAAALAEQGGPLKGPPFEGARDIMLVQGAPMGAPQPHRLLLPLILRIATAAAIEVFGAITRDALFSCMKWRLVVAMQKRLFASLLRQEMAFFDSHSTGALAGRLVNDTEDMQQVVTSGAQKLLASVLNIVVGSVLMFASSPHLTALGVIAVPCVCLGIGGAAKAMGNLGLLQNDLLADINSIATEVLGNVRTTQTNGAEDLEIQRYNACQDASLRVLRESIVAESFFKQTKQLLLLGTDLGLLAAGMSSVVRGRLTLGRFVSFRSYLRKFYYGVDKLTDIYADLEYSLRASDRYFQLIDRQPAVTNPKGAGPSGAPLQPLGVGNKGPARVEFKGVSFAYLTNSSTLSTAPQILRNFCMRVNPGEIVALVGPSGSGKSTIVKLAQRLYDPQVGEVYLDGVPLREISLKTLREAIGYVEQEPLLFKRSIADNIAYGLRPIESDSESWLGRRRDRLLTQQQMQQQMQQRMQQEGSSSFHSELARTLSHPEALAWDPQLLRRVVAAAAAANALPFVKFLPDGLFTVCGEGAVRLSGGQKQRIAVARALLREPRLLILDEASSCLDSESEASICEALKQLKGKTTVITIAHKHLSVKAADRVAVVDDGEVVEEGSPTELINKQNSKYRALLLQSN